MTNETRINELELAIAQKLQERNEYWEKYWNARDNLIFTSPGRRECNQDRVRKLKAIVVSLDELIIQMKRERERLG